MSRLRERWGADEFGRRTAEAMEGFLAASDSWLTVERSAGVEATAATWREVFDGSVPPSIGRIASLHD